MTKAVEVPTVHGNGTSGEALYDQVIEAGQAAYVLLKALEAAAPNGRDYYVSADPKAFERAKAQHEARAVKVRIVLAEMMEIAEGIANQID